MDFVELLFEWGQRERTTTEKGKSTGDSQNDDIAIKVDDLRAPPLIRPEYECEYGK